VRESDGGKSKFRRIRCNAAKDLTAQEGKKKEKKGPTHGRKNEKERMPSIRRKCSVLPPPKLGY